MAAAPEVPGCSISSSAGAGHRSRRRSRPAARRRLPRRPRSRTRGGPADRIAGSRRRCRRQLVVPGLIDLHTHVYWGGTSLGVDADALARRSGTTTFVDAGSAGPGNFPGFRHHVIERSRSRIIAYLNISFAGIYGFSRNVMVGECREIMLCDAREAVACAREHQEHDRRHEGAGRPHRLGTSGIAPMDIAMEAADRLGVPLMAHLDYPPPSRTEVRQPLAAWRRAHPLLQAVPQ